MKRETTIRWTLFAGLSAALVSGAAAAELKFGVPEPLQVPKLTELEGPDVVDFDGDGVLDLLSGNYAGNIIFRRNTGTNAEPKYADPVKLQRAGKDIKLKHW